VCVRACVRGLSREPGLVKTQADLRELGRFECSAGCTGGPTHLPPPVGAPPWPPDPACPLAAPPVRSPSSPPLPPPTPLGDGACCCCCPCCPCCCRPTTIAMPTMASLMSCGALSSCVISCGACVRVCVCVCKFVFVCVSVCLRWATQQPGDACASIPEDLPAASRVSRAT
jgi:hypothetical protein